MSDSTNRQNHNEEVDLGQLFHAIGRMFKRLFDFIGSILYSIFLAFVWIVFFIKKNIIVLVAALVVGLVYGYIQTKYSDPIYQSSALIKQNYPTGENLYSTLEYYNELISEGDSISLGESLDMDPSDAAQISGFDISTDFNRNDKIVLYDEYREEIDTSVVEFVTFEDYVENLEDHEYELQKVIIRFKKRDLFKQTLDKLIGNISSIEYFKELQQRDLNELTRRKEIIMQSLAQSDSLQKTYQRVLETNPELRENQTSITIENQDEKESSTKEYQLFLNDIRLRRELVQTEREREDLTNIIDVVSVNQNNGTKYNQKSIVGIGINAKYYYAVLFLFLAMIVLLVMELLKYLEKFKTKVQ